jgi:hypothetical protein
MGENYFTAVPVAFYGGVLLFSAILTVTLIAHHGKNSTIATAIGNVLADDVIILVLACYQKRLNFS